MNGAGGRSRHPSPVAPDGPARSAASPSSVLEWMQTDQARRFNIVRGALLRCNLTLGDDFKEASDALASLEGEMRALQLLKGEAG